MERANHLRMATRTGIWGYIMSGWDIYAVVNWAYCKAEEINSNKNTLNLYHWVISKIPYSTNWKNSAHITELWTLPSLGSKPAVTYLGKSPGVKLMSRQCEATVLAHSDI